MRRAKGDDEFRQFYERMEPRAIAVANRLTGSSAVAEDVAAEAFARAFSRWAKVRSHPNPDAWLLRVVGNLAVDHVRHEARRPHITEQSRADLPGDEAALRVDVARALDSLSARQREVVVMRYLIDLTEDDVAVQLGLSTGSVKTHLSRASAKLRDQLGDAATEDHSDHPDTAEASPVDASFRRRIELERAVNG